MKVELHQVTEACGTWGQERGSDGLTELLVSLFQTPCSSKQFLELKARWHSANFHWIESLTTGCILWAWINTSQQAASLDWSLPTMSLAFRVNWLNDIRSVTSLSHCDPPTLEHGHTQTHTHHTNTHTRTRLYSYLSEDIHNASPSPLP